MMSGLRRKWVLALLGLSWGTALGAQDPPVALRAEAFVQGGTIQLSDLLPLGAASGVRLAAEKLELGRAPEPGSLRVLSAAELRHAIGGAMAVKFPAQAVVHGAGWPLRVASLRRALRESEAGRRYDFSRSSLIPPADFATRSSDPRLEVVAIGAGENPRTLSVRLRCEQRADCGSFLVELVFDEALPAELQAQPPAGKSSLAQTGSANHAP